MKKQLIIVGSLLAALSVNAQWTTSGSDIYNSNAGNVGVGTTAPANMLHVETTTRGDGIKISKSGDGATGLHFYPQTGNLWSIYALGNLDGWGGAGDLAFQNQTTSPYFPYFYIKGNTGNIGMGTVSPSGRLHVVTSLSPSGAGFSQWGTKSEITQSASVGQGGPYAPFIGVEGNATTYYQGQSEMYGVVGIATNGQNNYGVYGEAYGGTISNYAGYFVGNVFRSGSDNFTSDRKLKNDIKPMTNSMDKLMKLKPSTYTFKVDEYKEMNLPSGQQMGLIAQELEEVFPELVTNMPKMERTNAQGKTITIPEFKSVQYISLIPVLISGLQEQQKTIQAQQKQIETLEQKASMATDLNNLSIEAGFQMSQNEPNPFTHETVVKYNLPATVTNAFMAVYDLTGKQVTTFPIEQKGSSSVTITSEKLVAGIYIYSIVADGKVVDSKRMVVADK